MYAVRWPADSDSKLTASRHCIRTQELEAKALRLSRLPVRFHVRDLVGGSRLLVTETTVGALVQALKDPGDVK